MSDTAQSRPLLDDGAMVDHFKVAHLLGRGGMGEVYLARDMQLGRKVALKIVRPEMIGDAQAVERFLFEARVTARFSHPHIVTIYAVGAHDGNPYVALEYLEGRTLRERMAEGALGPLEAARVAKEIAEALVEAHRSGVLHRDLKPENVHLPRDGRLRVLDFGLAKAANAAEVASVDTAKAATLVARSLPGFETRGSGPMGTPQYMAPEQWTEGACTGATDVWALGVTLFEMLEGRRPFAGATVFALCAAACAETSAPKVEAAGVPAELAALVARCLAKKPEERPAAAAIVEALDDVLSRGRGRARAEESPFRGLLPFTEQHAASFFGRDEEVAAFVERLRDEPIVAVVGPSGAGKSSFVQAGAVPRLREQGKWIVLSLRPGASPFEALASRVARGESDGLRTSTPTRTSLGASEEAALAAELRDAPGRLALVLGELAEREGARVLVLVDQLEELYALVPDEAVRRRFMEALCAAADDPAGPVRVVLTLRDDFLGKVAAGETARRALSRVTALRSPGPEALREIAARPLADAGYAYEDPELPAEMAAAVQGEPASLPLLQFALSALWEARDRERKIVPAAAYAALGGVEGALARHADGILAGLSPEDVRSAREIFLRLVTPEGTRRAVARDELLAGVPGGAAGVVDLLVRERALVSRKGRGEGGAELELVHESLIRRWEKLARWIDESREELVFLAEARQAAAAWEKRGRAADGLWRGDQLRDGERQASRLPSLPDDVRRFLDAGRALSSRRIKRKRIALTLGFAFLAAVAVVLFFMNREAVRQKRVAEEQRSEARSRQAEALVTGAAAALAQKDSLAAKAMLRAALELAGHSSVRALWPRAASDPSNWTLDLSTTVWGAAMFPDGKTVAIGGTDGDVYLIDTGAGSIVRTIRGHAGAVRAVELSPDGRRLASVAEGDPVRILDLEGGQTRLGSSRTARVFTLRFVGGGDRIAWIDREIIHLWDLRTEERFAFPPIERAGRGLAASPDGRWLAAGSGEKVVLFDVAARRAVRTLDGHVGDVRALAFDHTGARLATASLDDETIIVWRTDSWAEEARIVGNRVYYPFYWGGRQDARLQSTDDGRLRPWRTLSRA